MKKNYPAENEAIQIDWQPIGLKTEGGPDQTLLTAAQRSGIRLVAFCGGNGTCAACKVQLLSGTLSPLSESERQKLSAEEIASGIRLACQAKPLSDLKIHIPPSTLLTEQRLQLEGEVFFTETPLSSRVVDTLELSLAEPTITDSRADTIRLKDALTAAGITNPSIGNAVLHALADDLRSLQWHPQAVLRGNQVTAILPPKIAPLGLAVDIGTTKIAAYLVNLSTGKTLARQGMMNPQISYGEDVISRIAYANSNPDGREMLQKSLITAINDLIKALCRESGTETKHIIETVFVCNTAIHHFLCNLPVRQLGRYPFIAAAAESLNIPASDFGFQTAAGAYAFRY